MFDIFIYLHLNQWYSAWAKSPPRGDFMRYEGDFVIYQIWGRFQFPGGRFLQVRIY